MFKKIIRKVVDRLAGVNLKNEFTSLNQKIEQQAKSLHELSDGSLAVERLTKKLQHVENYQPVYGLRGLVGSPARDSEDRAQLIQEKLGDLWGKQILDIGSSLGYISFFLADRGAQVQGWEASPQNAEVARLISQINGIPVDFRTKELNLETVQEVPADHFDAVIVLSVFHHIIRFQGLEATQKMVKALLEKAPVMIVELAKKGEDPKLPWDKSQPANELDIFKGLDVTITKIGSFGNHLSNKKRPLYMVEANKRVSVNGKKYVYETMTHAAYKDSPIRRITTSHRKYYFSKEHIIKEYGLTHPHEKLFNVPEANTEIATLTALNKMKKNGRLSQDYPVLMDAEVTEKRSRIAIKRTPGILLSDLGSETPEAKQKIVKTVLQDILGQLAEIRSLNLHHNDVRGWNILYDEAKDGALLIDYGNVSRVAELDDVTQLVWALGSFISGSSEIGEEAGKLPDKAVFKGYAEALTVYALVQEGTTDPGSILKKVKF